MCENLGFEWTNNFILLGFCMENTMTKINMNFTKVKEKIEGLIRTWRPYNLSIRGKVTIAKTKLVSQLTYVATVLDIPADTVKEIQGQIDDFVLGIKPGGRKWMNHPTLYSHSSEGGMGMIMINLENFISALKTSWI